MQDSPNSAPSLTTVEDGGSSSLDSLSEALSASLDPSQLPSIDRAKAHTYGFVAQGIHFLLPQGLYCELLTQPLITPLPNSPQHFCGLSNVRGNLVPIYDLSALRADYDRTPKVKLALILGPVTSSAALVIDRNPSSINVDEAKPLTDSESKNLFQTTDLPDVIWDAVIHTITIDNTPWHQLDPKVLFSQLSRLTH